MSDLKLDYLTEAKHSIGLAYEAISDTQEQTGEEPVVQWLQVIAESLVSVATSLDIIARTVG